MFYIIAYQFENLSGIYSCFINYDSSVAYILALPLLALAILHVIILEVSFFTNYQPIHLTHKGQLFAAKLEIFQIFVMYKYLS